MREKRTDEISISEQYADHEIGRELKAMSAWLDDQSVTLDHIVTHISTTP